VSNHDTHDFVGDMESDFSFQMCTKCGMKWQDKVQHPFYHRNFVSYSKETLPTCEEIRMESALG